MIIYIILIVLKSVLQYSHSFCVGIQFYCNTFTVNNIDSGELSQSSRKKCINLLYITLFQHKFEGQLSLANAGQSNSNNSQFFITLAPCPHLDDKNVVFGCVRRGFGVAKEVSYVASENDKPLVVRPLNLLSSRLGNQFP